jgi:hypothetical protein
MKNVLIVFIFSISAQAFASVPNKVTEAAEALTLSSVKTVITKVTNTEGNPCIPEGDSYDVELQVKQANYDREKRKKVYKWETVKVINVSTDGSVMEVCAE